jgi:hypothetical protein
MKRHNIIARFTAMAALSLGLLAGSGTAVAHCDTLDGPVVAAARKALDSGNVNLILVWVQKKDESLETGKLQDVAKLISRRMEEGLHRNFEEVMKKKNYNPNDVAAGRAFASAYVEYTHYVERLYNAAETLAPEHVQKEAPGLAHSH